MEKAIFKEKDLAIIGEANPGNIPFITKGVTVWLVSGGPPLEVVEVDGEEVYVVDKLTKKAYGKIPKICLTPNPTPNGYYETKDIAPKGNPRYSL